MPRRRVNEQITAADLSITTRHSQTHPSSQPTLTVSLQRYIGWPFMGAIWYRGAGTSTLYKLYISVLTITVLSLTQWRV